MVIVDELTKMNRGIKRISKRYVCDKILHCNSNTFDKIVIRKEDMEGINL